jgi:hypothetical protein
MLPEEHPQRQQDNSVEAGMQPQAIRVTPNDRRRPLDPYSRLDFFDVHEFDDDVPYTLMYGKVHESSNGPLQYQYRAVWAAIQRYTGGVAAPGAITLEALDAQLAQLRQRASQYNLPAPPPLSEQQRQQMVQNAQVRQLFFTRINEAWRPRLLERVNEQAEEDDDEEDEDEDEDGEEENR